MNFRFQRVDKDDLIRGREALTALLQRERVDLVSAASGHIAIAVDGGLLQDMGAMYQFGGQIFRQVRVISKNPAGGDAVPYLICMPGGEYPTHGVSLEGAIVAAPVARLG